MEEGGRDVKSQCSRNVGGVGNSQEKVENNETEVGPIFSEHFVTGC